MAWNLYRTEQFAKARAKGYHGDGGNSIILFILTIGLLSWVIPGIMIYDLGHNGWSNLCYDWSQMSSDVKFFTGICFVLCLAQIYYIVKACLLK
jgi:uncharacterized protein with PQ loop repeat